VLILVLEFNLYLFSLFSCKVRNHIASYSKFISLCHMMLLMALLWSNVFSLIGTLLLCKWEKKGYKNLIFIEKFKWFLHNNGWGQRAKFISHLFLNSVLSYIILVTKLWFELHTILHWIIMPIKNHSKLGMCLGGVTSISLVVGTNKFV
jgi:hypothetical protein